MVKGTITLAGDDDSNKRNRKVILKNNAPFISCVSKINNELVENAEDLDIVIPMYNLLEYRKIIGKLQGHCLITTEMNQLMTLIPIMMMVKMAPC